MSKKLQKYIKPDLYELEAESHGIRLSTKKDSPPASALYSGAHGRSHINQEELEKQLLELQTQLDEAKNKNNEFDSRMKDRQERYIKREQEYRRIISEYESKILSTENGPELLDTTYKNTEKINDFHNQIIENISVVQDKTRFLLKDQEKNIIKDLNTKLNQRTDELNEERASQFKGLKGIFNKEKQLIEELEKRKFTVEHIDHTNKILHKQNSELRIQFLTQESEEPILLTKLQALKAKNTRLRGELEFLNQNSPFPPISNLQQDEEAPRTTGKRRPRSGVIPPSKSNKYEEVIVKLKRMLELERKNLRAAKTAYSRELEAKRELETLLKDCVDDVKVDINKKKMEQRTKGTGEETLEIDKIIEVLLSQERVLTLLYDKTFPPRTATKDLVLQEVESKYQLNIEHLDEHLSAIDSIYTKYEQEDPGLSFNDD